MTRRQITIESPFGPLRLRAAGDAITAIGFAERSSTDTDACDAPDDPLLQAAANQLGDYFSGRLQRFDMPLSPAGTPFQQRVWAALQQIPFGTTESYGELAARIGAAGSARAVGAANRCNPIAIVIPCHRVIGSNGTLTGYAGGLERKQGLLALERVEAVRGQGVMF